MNVNKGDSSSHVPAKGEMPAKVHNMEENQAQDWIKLLQPWKMPCFAKQVPVMALVLDQEWMIC